MKNKIPSILLSITLGMGVLAADFPSTHAVAKEQYTNQEVNMNNLYVIAFNNKLPDDYQEIIEKAGGKVVKTLPEVGGVEAQSNHPFFLQNLNKVSYIAAANREIPLVLNEQSAIPSTQQASAVNQMDQTSYWNQQWDIQRVTNNGQSYDIETGGYKDEDGNTIHKAIVGVIDTGIDESHPDLKNNIIGGRNLVPAGVGESETGDSNIMDPRN